MANVAILGALENDRKGVYCNVSAEAEQVQVEMKQERRSKSING